MKIRNFIFCLIILLASVVGAVSDFEEYCALKMDEVALIRRDDLPEEFGDGAYETVVEFIKKTRNLKNEWVIYFDYGSGEILKCVKGIGDNVNVKFEKGEFDGYRVASIHNHPADVYSPPSGKNFGILIRDFENYELVVGVNELWILKAKCVDPKLNLELKFSAETILDSCQEYCDNLYSDTKKADEVCDIMYGITLSNYINDKNVKDIQLSKRELNYD